jgi:hypothetical protein
MGGHRDIPAGIRSRLNTGIGVSMVGVSHSVRRAAGEAHVHMPGRPI